MANLNLKPCPFCGRNDAYIMVYDDEGNERGELGCDYESDPWSGLTYGLRHSNFTDCILASSVKSPMGDWLFDTAKEAAEAWNKRRKP